MSEVPGISVSLSDDAVEVIARRVAEILSAEMERHEPEPWIGVEEAAEHLHCKPQRIYSLVHQRRLRPRRDGARLLFRRSDLDAWLTSGAGTQVPPGDANGIRIGR